MCLEIPRSRMTSSPHKRDDLQKLHDLLQEKILRLRTAKAIETSAAAIFQLEKHIQEAETEKDKVAQEIAQLNQQQPSKQQQEIKTQHTKTILILAANPKDTPQLRLEEEIR